MERFLKPLFLSFHQEKQQYFQGASVSCVGGSYMSTLLLFYQDYITTLLEAQRSRSVCVLIDLDSQ